MSGTLLIPHAAIDRPLPLRMRPDLQVAEQWFAGRRHFVVKDPLTLVFSYLTEQEHYILALLDGWRSISEIQERFVAQFAPQQVAAGEIHGFLTQLHRSGLVLGESPGQGEALERRRLAKQDFDLLRWAEKILAIRWRGINPEPLLDWLTPKVGWLFSPLGFVLWLTVVVFAALVMAAHFEVFLRRLPMASVWLTGRNLLLVGTALVVIKSLHELGHALAARVFGCRCREIGIQLFFLMPCLYTNVSDVWLLPSKRQRIAISAAGMYVELLLAAIAALIWWQAEPGILSSLCQSVILVASLGTVILNGNPLMRYDGYYIVSDALEIPNLEQRSRSQLVAWLARWCVGIDWQPADELDRRPRPLLAAYAAAAMAYRGVVLVGVYLASRAMLQPYRAEPLSDLLIVGAVIGLFAPLAMTGGHFLVEARRQNELHPARLMFTVAVAMIVVALACFVPFPQRVNMPVVIEPREAARIYATVPGILVDALPPGTSVKVGDPIAHLENLDQHRDLARLEGERQQQAIRLIELETLRGDDPARAAAIPTARQSLADLDTRVAELRELLDRLTLRAPHDGVVLPPPARQAQKSVRALERWIGTPLDHENAGAAIETGTLFCLVARRGSLDAVGLVNQADAPLIQPGRAARLSVAQSIGGALRGIVEQTSQFNSEELSPHLAAIREIPQRRDSSGGQRTLEPTYKVRIRLDNAPAEILPGATGRALIVAPPQPLMTRIMRWLGRTFRFRG